MRIEVPGALETSHGSIRRKLEQLRAAVTTSMLRSAILHWSSLSSDPRLSEWLGEEVMVVDSPERRHLTSQARRRALKIMKLLQSVRSSGCGREPDGAASHACAARSFNAAPLLRTGVES
eukprot:scaffold34633_cov25-Tisochrysis_lutea.AAC.1